MLGAKALARRGAIEKGRIPQPVHYENDMRVLVMPIHIPIPYDSRLESAPGDLTDVTGRRLISRGCGIRMKEGKATFGEAARRGASVCSALAGELGGWGLARTGGRSGSAHRRYVIPPHVIETGTNKLQNDAGSIWRSRTPPLGLVRPR